MWHCIDLWLQWNTISGPSKRSLYYSPLLVIFKSLFRSKCSSKFGQGPTVYQKTLLQYVKMFCDSPGSAPAWYMY